MKILLSSLISILFLSSCKQATTNVVEAVTDSILQKVSIQLSVSEDLGEISVGSDDRDIVVQVKNNSSDPIRKLSMSIGKGQSVLKFKPDADSIYTSPGFGGTCSEELQTGDSCTFVLQLTTRKPGDFNVPIAVSYENTIEPQSEQFSIKALIGEPASLVFTNDKTLYDFGVLEQTDISDKEIELEIQNVGGLKSRSSTISFVNESGDAFELKSHNCPTEIKPLEKCNVKVGYRSKNNNYTDPEVKYASKFTLNYVKDPEGRTAKLNGSFKYISSTIEAKLSTNYSPITFDTLVAGNKQVKNIKVTNNGYKAGIIKQIIFNDPIGLPFATCIKGTNNHLNCQKSLFDLPFEVEDLNNCLENQVNGIVGKVAGASCFFNITYWPSVNYKAGSQILHDFEGATLSFVYDSQWRDQENIVTKNNMFNISANYYSNAQIDLDSIMVETNYLNSSLITNVGSETFEANLGRLAKISDVSYDTFYKLIFKNNGETAATLQGIFDGSVSPKEITETGADLNSYYRAVKYNSCGFIAPGATCSVSFSLTPLALGNVSSEDSLMYDNVSDPLKKYKILNFKYLDGASFQDDGSVATDRITNIRLIAKLIAKGSLVFVENLSQTFPQVPNGITTNHIITLKNVGTGDVFAISHHSVNNLEPKFSTWPLKIQNLTTIPLPSTKDCYDILYPKNNPLLSDSPNPTRFLAPNESCALSISNSAPESFRYLATEYPSSIAEYNRFYAESLLGNNEIWQRKGLSYSPIKLSFQYFDGDVDPENSASIPFGLSQVTKEMNITTSFRSPAYLIFRNPMPMQSGVLYRPGLTYPSFSVTEPVNAILNSYTVTPAFFDYTHYTNINNTFVKSTVSKNHVNTLGSLPNTYTYHIGTFKVGETFVGSLNLSNVGGSPATSVDVVEEAISSPISLTKYNNLTSAPYPQISISPNQNIAMEFTFNPISPGVFKRCYLFNYNNQIGGNIDQSVCVMATAVANIPSFDFKVQDIDVAYNSITDQVTETPTGVWTTYTSPINGVINPPITFNGIRNSKAYALKLLRITNTGTVAATKFSTTFLTSLNTPGAVISEITTRSSTSGNPTCLLDMTINPGQSCDLYIKYKPLTATTAIYAPYIGVIYERIANQFASQSLGLRFVAVDPATLSPQSLTAEIVTNWKNPLSPIPVSSSYPLALNGFGKSGTHFKLTSYSSNKIFTVVVNNTSAIKASFLSMNSNPSGSWSEVYNDSSMIIEANRGCFYGDDEFAAIASEEKGFNNSTTNKCNLRFTFSGKTTYSSCSAWNAPTKTKVVKHAGAIQASCNPFVYELSYYNYKRSATDKITFHVKGFIEPNQVQTISQLSNVQAYSTSSTKGAISFTIPTLQEVDVSLGTILKYRVYYSINFDDFYNQNIFFAYNASPVMSYIESVSPNITISNLNKGSYYFFRVAAIREFNDGVNGNINYVSLSNLDILTLPIPDQSSIYWHSNKALIDKSFQATPGTLSQAQTNCTGKNYIYSIKGTSKSFAKALINSQYWQKIISDPNNSSGYPVNDPGAVPHWLNDSARNIATNVSLYDNSTISGIPNYDPLAISGGDEDLKLLYSKACTNNASCDFLYKIVGGDDVDLYFQGTFYTYPTGASAYARCFAIIKCPTNTSLDITSGSCAKP